MTPSDDQDLRSQAFIVTGSLICTTQDQLDRVRRHLPEHIRLTRAEDGCEMFEVTQSKDAPMIWHVKERFRDHDAFEEHQERTRRSDWADKTADIERDFRVFHDR